MTMLYTLVIKRHGEHQPWTMITRSASHEHHDGEMARMQLPDEIVYPLLADDDMLY